MAHRKDILTREVDIRKWVDAKKSKAYICTQLKCQPGTLDSYLKKFGIEYSGNKGGKGKTVGPKRPVDYYLKKNFAVNSHWLKLRLYDEGLKEPKCEECSITEWNGKDLSFHLDHEDGDHFNNEIDNLRILCPNCHSQTETYSVKNLTRRLAEMD